MNFLEKLDMLMAEKGLNKHTLALSADIPYSTIDGWYKKGYAKAKLSSIEKLAKYFYTSLDYLMRDEITDRDYGIKTSTGEITGHDLEIIEKYHQLDPRGQQAVLDTIERELSFVNDHTVTYPVAARDAGQSSVTEKTARQSEIDKAVELLDESQERADKKNEGM